MRRDPMAKWMCCPLVGKARKRNRPHCLRKGKKDRRIRVIFWSPDPLTYPVEISQSLQESLEVLQPVGLVALLGP